jgi:hypothetical protein
MKGHSLISWGLLVSLLAVGLPLFLRMPLWADVTLYDLAARNVLSGGLHYRDVFDTNPPGIVWVHAAVRSVLGWRSEAIRLFDFGVVSAVILLLLRWLPPGRRVWAALLLYLFYFGTSEWCHCQRDVWMLLPALAALRLRQSGLGHLAAGDGRSRRAALRSFTEGALWGFALWVKPFVALPALACWLVGCGRLVRAGRTAACVRDTASLLSGGLLVGGLGILWLGCSGTWPYFWEVFLGWNPEYAAVMRAAPWWARLGYAGVRLWPWGLVSLAGVPLAALAVCRGLPGLQGGRASRPPAGGTPAPRGSLSLLGAFYLGWFVQATLVQVPFDYTLAPQVFLGLTLLLGWDWPGRTVLWARAALAALALMAVVEHPLLQRQRLSAWGACWQEGGGAGLRDRLQLTEEVAWEDLEAVAVYLDAQHLRDRELTCWNNATHPLYLELGLRPSIRYLHVDTVLKYFPRHREEVREEVAACGHRYVVSDLAAAGWTRAQAVAWARSGRPLAAALPPGCGDAFPWSEPVVFHSGRYVVHRVTGRPVALRSTTAGRVSAVGKRHPDGE